MIKSGWRAIGSRAIRARATACCPPRVRFRKLILSIPLHRSSAVDRLIMQRGIGAISSEERIPDSVVPFPLPRSLVPCRHVALGKKIAALLTRRSAIKRDGAYCSATPRESRRGCARLSCDLASGSARVPRGVGVFHPRKGSYA